jgi:hypothetical protein
MIAANLERSLFSPDLRGEKLILIFSFVSYSRFFHSFCSGIDQYRARSYSMYISRDFTFIFHLMCNYSLIQR